jgi:ketosteroid isomerase-like protein
MADREAMIDTIHRAYAARGTGNVAEVMAAFHPDNAHFEIKGDKDIVPVVGAVRGHANVHAAMDGFIQTFEFVKRDIVDTVVEGNRVVGHSRCQIRFVPKDVVVTTDVLDTFRFEDGKIVEFVEFADTALIKHLIS